jgi:hypothetical protein
VTTPTNVAATSTRRDLTAAAPSAVNTSPTVVPPVAGALLAQLDAEHRP